MVRCFDESEKEFERGDEYCKNCRWKEMAKTPV